ncbi:PAS domain S-box protein [Aquincola sp. S2]|uniref:histidine kinase n=1 Tax=Pseudaquabacterium terrae TaxID=2732868 RepID=A0ABX2ESI3_9BURK|nr:ATP-binding protein [Aquabacterium terrae]NRF71558.1 PAS domain S-box protein [Aquabacterium terrae]
MTPAVPRRERLLYSRWPWLLASLVLMLGLVGATVLGWLWYADQREAQDRRAALDFLWLEQTVQQTLTTNQRLLANWAHDLAPPTNRDAIAEFITRSGGLMRDNLALLAVELLDRHGRRITGLPHYGDERPATLPPLTDPLVTGAIERARSLERPEYSRVIEQGAPLWALAVPIADEAGEHGTVLALYDLDRLLEQEVPWWFVQRYELSLVDRHNKRLSPRDGALPERIDTVTKLNFGPADSGLALWASPHAPAHTTALLGALVLALLLFALLVIVLLRLLQRWLRERQAAQQALQDALRFREAMENSLPTGLMAFDRAGRIIYANRALGRMLGLAAETLVGAGAPFPFWPAQREADCAAQHAAMLAGASPADGQPLELQRADGSLFWARLFVSPLADGASAPKGWMVSLYDTTAERTAAHIARERDALLQHTARLASLAEFASGIAHELNQPLAAIANYAAVADSGLAQSPPRLPTVQDAVARLGEEAHRAGRIIHSLRSFIHKRAVEHRPHRVGDLLTEPLALLAPLAERLQVPVRVIADDDELRIDGDGVMIEQVLFNLLRNALEAVATLPAPPPADAVSVRIEADGDEAVTVTIEDRGPGFADAAPLFQPFYTTKSDGMGLGLAICRTVIESHGGRLWAEAREGGGARLAFRLPRSTTVLATESLAR